MTFGPPNVRRRIIALSACSLLATIVPLSAVAEYGIPAGSGAITTAGQPMLVRVTPGWDAAVAYEIADGSYVTVWDVAQTAPDGSLWYPVDGGFLPVDAVSSVGAAEGTFQYFQEAAPADTASQGWVDPTTGEWVDPAASQGWVDPNTGQWVEPSPVEAAWVEPAATGGWVDPNTGQWVEPAASEGWVDPNSGQWVESTGTEGWVDPNTGQWVAPASVALAQPVAVESWTDPAPLAVENSGGGEPWTEPIATAYITGTNGNSVACRAAPDRGTSKIADLFEGEAVEVRGEAVGEWQPVNCAGVGGYVNTSFVSWESGSVKLEQKRRDRNRDRDRDKNGNAGNAGVDGTATSSGQQVASFAQQYVGYPYTYAGEGPYAFDCSGLTKFVILNTLGIDITHDLFAQYDMGQKVGRDELQPGDLVFFQNTFRPGLSHNGIYIGGGQFVHAENEQTGVKISDLNSDYYSSRWYGAVRLT